jgi:hypothetical protein
MRENHKYFEMTHEMFWNFFRCFFIILLYYINSILLNINWVRPNLTIQVKLKQVRLD